MHLADIIQQRLDEKNQNASFEEYFDSFSGISALDLVQTLRKINPKIQQNDLFLVLSGGKFSDARISSPHKRKEIQDALEEVEYYQTLLSKYLSKAIGISLMGDDPTYQLLSPGLFDSKGEKSLLEDKLQSKIIKHQPFVLPILRKYIIENIDGQTKIKTTIKATAGKYLCILRIFGEKVTMQELKTLLSQPQSTLGKTEEKFYEGVNSGLPLRLIPVYRKYRKQEYLDHIKSTDADGESINFKSIHKSVQEKLLDHIEQSLSELVDIYVSWTDSYFPGKKVRGESTYKIQELHEMLHDIMKDRQYIKGDRENEVSNNKSIEKVNYILEKYLNNESRKNAKNGNKKSFNDVRKDVFGTLTNVSASGSSSIYNNFYEGLIINPIKSAKKNQIKTDIALLENNERGKATKHFETKSIKSRFDGEYPDDSVDTFLDQDETIGKRRAKEIQTFTDLPSATKSDLLFVKIFDEVKGLDETLNTNQTFKEQYREYVYQKEYQSFYEQQGKDFDHFKQQQETLWKTVSTNIKEKTRSSLTDILSDPQLGRKAVKMIVGTFVRDQHSKISIQANTERNIKRDMEQIYQNTLAQTNNRSKENSYLRELAGRKDIKGLIDKGKVHILPHERPTNTAGRGIYGRMQMLRHRYQRGRHVDIQGTQQKVQFPAQIKNKKTGEMVSQNLFSKQFQSLFLPPDISSAQDKSTDTESSKDHIVRWLDVGLDTLFGKKNSDSDAQQQRRSHLQDSGINLEDDASIQQLRELLKYLKHEYTQMLLPMITQGINDRTTISKDFFGVEPEAFNTQMKKRKEGSAKNVNGTNLTEIFGNFVPVVKDLEGNVMTQTGFGPIKDRSRVVKKFFDGKLPTDLTRGQTIYHSIADQQEGVATAIKYFAELENVESIGVQDKTGDKYETAQKPSGYRETKLLIKLKNGNVIEWMFHYQDMLLAKQYGTTRTGPECTENESEADSLPGVNFNLIKHIQAEGISFTPEEYEIMLKHNQQMSDVASFPPPAQCESILQEYKKNEEEYQKIHKQYNPKTFQPTERICADHFFHIYRDLSKNSPLFQKLAKTEQLINDEARRKLLLQEHKQKNVKGDV